MRQVFLFQVRLMREQQIMHRPEFSLGCSRLRGLGREQRLRMRIFEREMPINETNFVRIALDQQRRRRRREFAARARVVPILDDRHLRMLGAECVVRWLGRHGQRDRLDVLDHEMALLPLSRVIELSSG
jgi:hypothetical protein